MGFGTYEGTMIAVDCWGDPFTIIKVPPAKRSKWEGQLHAATVKAALYAGDSSFLITIKLNELSYWLAVSARAHIVDTFTDCD